MSAQSQQLQWETDEFSDELQKIQRFVHETARQDRRREWMSDIVRNMKDHLEDIAPDAPQTMADMFLQKLSDLEHRNDGDMRFESVLEVCDGVSVTCDCRIIQ